MNYDHGFHAGNFADVLKHGVLADLVSRMVHRPGGLTVIDSHAGAGWYDLSSPESLRGGEVRQGAQRLFAKPGLPKVLAAWHETLKAANPEGALLRYPGSPLVALHHMRAKGDFLVAIERNQSVYGLLASALAGERRARAVRGDGYGELLRHLPAATPQLLVLVDPPFESPADYSRAAEAVVAARAMAPQGIFLIWLPDKGGKEAENVARAVAEGDHGDSTTHLMRLRVRAMTQAATGAGTLAGTALVIAGAPRAFIDDWSRDLAALAHLLRQGEGFGAGIQAITHVAPHTANRSDDRDTRKPKPNPGTMGRGRTNAPNRGKTGRTR